MDYQPFSGTSDPAGGTDSELVGSASTAGFLNFGSTAGDGSDTGGNGGGSGGGIGGDDFDPAIHVGRDKRNADGSYRKRRGRRPSASSGSRKSSNNSASLDALTRTIFIAHLGIATATKTPELALEDKESETLAVAVSNVLEEFDIKPNPKAEAIIGLIIASGSIYGPRIYNIRARKKTE